MLTTIPQWGLKLHKYENLALILEILDEKIFRCLDFKTWSPIIPDPPPNSMRTESKEVFGLQGGAHGESDPPSMPPPPVIISDITLGVHLLLPDYSDIQTGENEPAALKINLLKTAAPSYFYTFIYVECSLQQQN